MRRRSLFSVLILVFFVGTPTFAQNDDVVVDESIDRSSERPGITDLFDIDAPSSAARDGFWSQHARWPICPIHAALLPNGDVMTYGTTEAAENGLGFVYDRWNPDRGLAPNSHAVFDVQTGNNIFCSAQALLPGTGGLMLVTGGSVEKNGRRNFGTKHANVYDPTDNRFFQPFGQMKFARWYPTVTQLATGRLYVLGGRDENRKPTTTPEVFDPVTGTWTAMTGAKSGLFENGGWNYPRAFVGRDGNVLMMPMNRTGLFSVSIRGNGSIKKIRELPVKVGGNNNMAVMYAENQILAMRGRDSRKLTLREDGTVRSDNIPDFRGDRLWADATLLPNGEVLVTGGARVNQSEADAVREVEIWNPETESWRVGARQAKSRLYHSTSLLLPNGTVFVGGGGPPGEVAHLNAEIYYPPYLFTSSGDLRQRPRLLGESGSGSVIRVRAWGDEGTERMAFTINGERMKTVDVTTSGRSYYYTTDRPVTGDQVRIEFLNDDWRPSEGIDSNLNVDYMEIDGLRHQSEDPRTFVRQRNSGFLERERLAQTGYFEYFDQSTGCTNLGQVAYSQELTCSVDRQGSIETVRMIRFGSVTHSFDMGQRGLTLEFSQTSNSVSFKMPTLRKSAPPGFYMVFLVNDSGTPSEAAIVELL